MVMEPSSTLSDLLSARRGANACCLCSVMSFVGHDYVLPRVNGSDAVSYSAHDGGSDTE